MGSWSEKEKGNDKFHEIRGFFFGGGKGLLWAQFQEEVLVIKTIVNLISIRDASKFKNTLKNSSRFWIFN